MITGYRDVATTQVDVINCFREKYPELLYISQGTVGKIEKQFHESGYYEEFFVHKKEFFRLTKKSLDRIRRRRFTIRGHVRSRNFDCSRGLHPKKSKRNTFLQGSIYI